MTWVLAKEFTFEAAHRLPHHDGKCRRLHGHSWKGLVYVSAATLHQDGAKRGMVMDYSEIKAMLKPLVDDYLDHHFLNDTLKLENPTSELVAQWIYNRLTESGLRGLLAVEIRETCTSRCVYTGRGHGSSFLSDALIVGNPA